MSTDELVAEHERCRKEALAVFRQARKMGGADYSFAFLEKLENEISEAYENFVKVNNGKNLFKSMRTPAVLFTILVIDYVLQEIFQLLGLNVLATACSTLLGILLLTLGVWAYTRYSGTMRDAGIVIDELCEWIWQNALSPLTKEGMKKAASIGSSDVAGAALRKLSTRLAPSGGDARKHGVKHE